MEEYKWKIGDRIILKSGTRLPGDTLYHQGHCSRPEQRLLHVYANLGYLQDVLDNRGRVKLYLHQVDDPFIIPQMCRKLRIFSTIIPVPNQLP